MLVCQKYTTQMHWSSA